MNKKIKVKIRYIAYIIKSSNSFELDQKKLFQLVRKEYTQLYGLIDYSKSCLRVIEFSNNVLLISVSNKHLGKLISSTALIKQPRLIPITLSGTIKKLKKKIEKLQHIKMF